MYHRHKCQSCKYYDGLNENGRHKHTCSAFPDGIPFNIWDERILHFYPINQQTGNFVFPFGDDEKLKILDLLKEKSKIENEIIERLQGVMTNQNKVFNKKFKRIEIRIERLGKRKSHLIRDGVYALFFDEDNQYELGIISSKSKSIIGLLD